MPSRLLLPVLALAVFFVGATEFMIAPMLTPIATAFAAPPAAAAWLISAYALAYALGAPLFGLLAHRLSRRRLLIAALILLAADGVAVTLAPSLAIAIALRVLGGLAAAALIPAVFALIADHYPPRDHAAAMGLAMLGMTAGIIGGPALAGVLTEAAGWRAPFLASAAGCLVLLPFASIVLPRREAAPHAAGRASPAILLRPAIARLITAKALYNGAAVAGFALSGEILRRRYGIDTAQTGLAVTAFGGGLAAGNLTVGRARRALAGDEALLLAAVGLLCLAFAAFLALPLPLAAALVALALWGAALGLAAPASTALLAARAAAAPGSSRGLVLSVSESANNIALMALLTLASLALEQRGAVASALVLGIGLGAGGALLIADRVAQSKPAIRP
ncbi:MFS transporter [Nitratireductor soli]|uniref:MFS transporter n=1 Tax=Nitratireductor soli TaxID=1670619 RepID=UPI00065E9633